MTRWNPALHANCMHSLHEPACLRVCACVCPSVCGHVCSCVCVCACVCRRLSVEGRVKDDDGVYRYVSTRSATPRAARGGAPTAARAPSPMPSNRIGSPLPSRGSNRVGGSMPVPGSPAHRTKPNTPGNNGSNGSRASASINPVAYSLFCEEFRGAMKAKYPGASPQDLAQILAAEWQAVLPSTRARYERMASHERMPSPSGSRG